MRKKRINLMKPKFLYIPDVMSTEIKELNIRYKLRIIKNKSGLKSQILIFSFEKYIKKKQKLKKITFNNETLEPITIEMGKTESNINEVFIFMFSNFFI
tara:strand:- start:288 stop:584 length:297 start_codon:yes stop_codon:yes gene_type:complete